MGFMVAHFGRREGGFHNMQRKDIVLGGNASESSLFFQNARVPMPAEIYAAFKQAEEGLQMDRAWCPRQSIERRFALKLPDSTQGDEYVFVERDGANRKPLCARYARKVYEEAARLRDAMRERPPADGGLCENRLLCMQNRSGESEQYVFPTPADFDEWHSFFQKDAPPQHAFVCLLCRWFGGQRDGAFRNLQRKHVRLGDTAEESQIFVKAMKGYEGRYAAGGPELALWEPMSPVVYEAFKELERGVQVKTKGGRGERTLRPFKLPPASEPEAYIFTPSKSGKRGVPDAAASVGDRPMRRQNRQMMIAVCKKRFAKKKGDPTLLNINSKTTRTSFALWVSKLKGPDLMEALRALRMLEKPTYAHYKRIGINQHEVTPALEKSHAPATLNPLEGLAELAQRGRAKADQQQSEKAGEEEARSAESRQGSEKKKESEKGQLGGQEVA